MSESAANGDPPAFGLAGLRNLRMALTLLGAIFLGSTGSAFAARPGMVVPPTLDTIVERLPPGYGKLAVGSGPMTPAQTVAQVDSLLMEAARTGDSRLAARADGLLGKFPAATQQADVLRARAFSAQHRHDFASALRLLDRMVALEPRDGDARMSRAQINLVQGRVDLARAECGALVLGIDSGNGILCTASVSLRQGQLDVAARTLDGWLAEAPASDLRRGYATLMRAEVAARAKDAQADGFFRQALALDPADVKTLAAYARHLRASGRDAEVEPLLAGNDIDGLQLQRALAAHATGAGNAAALADAQARRYETAHAVGSQPEMRDEADFLLILRQKPEAALALAQRNFRFQRDYEDIDVLARAALAAGKPQALDPVRSWALQQRLELDLPKAATP